MAGQAVPAALRERLGAEATGGLVDMFGTARREWSDDVIEVCATRFERRVTDEISHLRHDMIQGDGALRQETTELGAKLRQEMTELGADLRQGMTELGADLRQEMTELGADLRRETQDLGAGLRKEMSDGRFELLKWCFLFWAGQVVAIAAIMGVMLRFARL